MQKKYIKNLFASHSCFTVCSTIFIMLDICDNDNWKHEHRLIGQSFIVRGLHHTCRRRGKEASSNRPSVLNLKHAACSTTCGPGFFSLSLDWNARMYFSSGT